jgi:hypothetical protein
MSRNRQFPQEPMNVPLQNAALLGATVDDAQCVLTFNARTGQMNVQVSGNFPIHSLIALLEKVKLTFLSQMGARQMENNEPGESQANPAEQVVG